jgi:formylglycine-generating enzyme required for sulfatase activity
MKVQSALAILVVHWGAGCGGRTQLEFTSGNSSDQVGGAPQIGGTSATGGTVVTSIDTSAGGKPAGGASHSGATTGAGGMPAGGVSHSGATTGAGGKPAGGVSHSGGTAPDNSDSGVGCSGSFEHIQNVNGQDLCVGTSVWINGPSGSPSYQIDATEVTRGQYESWVATDPALPPSSDTACAWKATGDPVDASADGEVGYDEVPSCMTAASVCRGAGCDHHPVVCVDWCDAYYYCAAVGKRLCGKIGGGSVVFNWGDTDKDPSASQWYRACSSGGATQYPYGDQYERTYCNGYDYWAQDSSKWTTVPVASLSRCQSSTPGYSGAYDLSGSVFEWEDSCYDTVKRRLLSDGGIETVIGPAACLLRGGAFDSWGFGGYGSYAVGLRCDSSSDSPDHVDIDVGFRCCSR